MDTGSTTDRHAVQQRNDARIADLQASVEQLQVQHREIKQQIAANTALTEQVHTNTKDLVEAWTALAGGVRVLGWLGHIAKWAAGLLALGTAVWGAMHLGSPPKP